MGDIPEQDPNGQPPRPPQQPPAGINLRTNGLAIISLVFVLIICIFAVALFFAASSIGLIGIIGTLVGLVGALGIAGGHFALSRIKRTGAQGRPLAITVLVLGYVTLSAVVVGGVLLLLFLKAMSNLSAPVPDKASSSQSLSQDTRIVPSNSNSYGGITCGADGQQWQSGTFADFMNTVLAANSQPLA